MIPLKCTKQYLQFSGWHLKDRHWQWIQLVCYKHATILCHHVIICLLIVIVLVLCQIVELADSCAGKRDTAKNNAFQVHAGEDDHTWHGWTTSRRGQDSPWKSQSEWQRTVINGEIKSMVWPTLGSRTTKEHNRLSLFIFYSVKDVLCCDSWLCSANSYEHT